jgi:hypothetical protein
LDATPGYDRIDDMVAEGDRVVTRLTAIGTHEGDLPGIPRTVSDLACATYASYRDRIPVVAVVNGEEVATAPLDEKPLASVLRG